jgi:hypothetical protein
MILRAYIDDSDINQEPVSVLAGLIGPAERWARFSDDWKAALDWRKLRRFKMKEFLGQSGEFLGWPDEISSQFVRYLMNLIREQAFKGIGTVLPSRLYREVFGKKNQRAFDVPYALLLFQLVSITLQRFVYPDIERIDFVFDVQEGQDQFIRGEWRKFMKCAPERLRERLGDPPIFRSDEDVMPLQAADLYAGWIRHIAPFMLAGESPPNPPWHGQEATIDSWTDYFTADGLKAAYAALESGRGK